MPLPNFVVVGAPKCGTTSLYHYLKQHPEIYLPARKELHYFSREHVLRDMGGPGDQFLAHRVCPDAESYAAEFAPAGGEKARGEISPSYFDFPEVAEAIRRELGDPAIVILLRDPIAKAFSQYMHLVRDGRETLTFHDALMAEPDRTGQRWSLIWRYASSSLYAGRVRHYLDTFGPGRVRIFLFEEFVREPQRVLDELWHFLGVDPGVRADTTQVFNASSRPRSRFLAGLVSKRSPLAAVARAVVPEAARLRAVELVRKLNSGKRGEVDDRSRAHLRDYFGADVKEVETILGRRTGWLR
jgi:hypothetical protein